MFRAARTVRVEDRYTSSPQQLQLEYDQLVLAAGPWTNQLLGAGVMDPPLQLLPLVVSNEQTQVGHFCLELQTIHRFSQSYF